MSRAGGSWADEPARRLREVFRVSADGLTDTELKKVTHGANPFGPRVLQAAYAAHPERFVRRVPTPPALPTAAWINKPINPHNIVS